MRPSPDGRDSRRNSRVVCATRRSNASPCSRKPSTRCVTGNETNGKTQRLTAETAANSGSMSLANRALRLLASQHCDEHGASAPGELFDELLAHLSAVVEHFLHDQ